MFDLEKLREDSQQPILDIDQTELDTVVQQAKQIFVEYINSDDFEFDAKELTKAAFQNEDVAGDNLFLHLYIDVSVNRYSGKPHPYLGFVFGGNGGMVLKSCSIALNVTYNSVLLSYIALFLRNRPFDAVVSAISEQLRSFGANFVGSTIEYPTRNYCDDIYRIPITAVISTTKQDV